MNWTKLAEDRIEEAIANGEFKNLPGQGQPLDLAEYFALPAAERAGAALLKNANVVPQEVQLLKEIGELEKAIEKAESRSFAGKQDGKNRNNGNHASQHSQTSHSSHDDHLTRLREQLQEKRVTFALAMERRRRREPRSLD
jgi:hypothetical protein